MRGWKWPCQSFYNIFSEHYPSFHCVSYDKEHCPFFHCVMDMVLLLNIASKPTYSFLYDMYNDVEPSTNHCEQKNKPRTGTQGFQC